MCLHGPWLWEERQNVQRKTPLRMRVWRPEFTCPLWPKHRGKKSKAENAISASLVESTSAPAGGKANSL